MKLTALYQKLRSSTLARNTVWMCLGHAGRLPVQAVYFVLIARSLGSQGYGAFVGVTALVAILAPFVTLGSGNLLIKHVSRDHSCFGRCWGNALLRTLASGCLLMLMATLLSSLLLPKSISLALIVSTSAADLICNRIIEISIQAFQGFQKLSRASQLTVLPNVLRLLSLAILLLFVRHPSATVWGYVYLASLVVSALIALWLVRKDLGEAEFRRGTLFGELKEGLYFSVSLSSQNIYNDLDKTLLARMSTLDAAGLYGAAYRIVDVSFTPVRSLLYAAYARFFQSGSRGIGGSVAFAARLLPFAVGYGLLATVVLYLCAPVLPYFLGNQYLGVVQALRYLSLLPLLKACHYFAADSLTGAGFQGARSACQLAAALLNVGLILLLVPAHSWRGAAWASLATDSALALTMWLLVLRLRKREESNNAHIESAIGAVDA